MHKFRDNTDEYCVHVFIKGANRMWLEIVTMINKFTF